MITPAKLPPAARIPSPQIETDDWNARQVADRQDRSIEELLEDLRKNIRRDLQVVGPEPQETCALY
jgi:hypothetical protein